MVWVSRGSARQSSIKNGQAVHELGLQRCSQPATPVGGKYADRVANQRGAPVRAHGPQLANPPRRQRKTAREAKAPAALPPPGSRRPRYRRPTTRGSSAAPSEPRPVPRTEWPGCAPMLGGSRRMPTSAAVKPSSSAAHLVQQDRLPRRHPPPTPGGARAVGAARRKGASGLRHDRRAVAPVLARASARSRAAEDVLWLAAAARPARLPSGCGGGWPRRNRLLQRGRLLWSCRERERKRSCPEPLCAGAAQSSRTDPRAWGRLGRAFLIAYLCPLEVPSPFGRRSPRRSHVELVRAELTLRAHGLGRAHSHDPARGARHASTPTAIWFTQGRGGSRAASHARAFSPAMRAEAHKRRVDGFSIGSPCRPQPRRSL